jgi:hypothetical protein
MMILFAMAVSLLLTFIGLFGRVFLAVPYGRQGSPCVQAEKFGWGETRDDEAADGFRAGYRRQAHARGSLASRLAEMRSNSADPVTAPALNPKFRRLGLIPFRLQRAISCRSPRAATRCATVLPDERRVPIE